MASEQIKSAEVPEAMGDAEAKKVLLASDLYDMHKHVGWYSAPEKNFKEKGVALILSVAAARDAQWQSTRLRGGVPEGWKLVPVEPTKEMIQAACDKYGYPSGNRWVYRDGYRAMLQAAPPGATQMSNAKHTPGPWSSSMWTDDVAGAVGWSIVCGDAGHRVPTNTFETDDEEEAEANARLIAAAPELLEALQAYDAWADKTPPHDQELKVLRERIRAAIAKATGEQPK